MGSVLIYIGDDACCFFGYIFHNKFLISNISAGRKI